MTELAEVDVDGADPLVGSALVGNRQHDPPHPARRLDGGGDGLDVHRRIVATARDWLAPGGRLLIEVSDAQVGPAVSLFGRAGLLPAVHTDDDLDATAVVGTSPAAWR